MTFVVCSGHTEKHYVDGTKEVTLPDQSVKYMFANGSEETVFADGTVTRVDKDGDVTIEFPNGQREIHTQHHKVRFSTVSIMAGLDVNQLLYITCNC
jgi:centromere protein J